MTCALSAVVGLGLLLEVAWQSVAAVACRAAALPLALDD